MLACSHSHCMISICDWVWNNRHVVCSIPHHIKTHGTVGALTLAKWTALSGQPCLLDAFLWFVCLAALGIEIDMLMITETRALNVSVYFDMM